MNFTGSKIKSSNGPTQIVSPCAHLYVPPAVFRNTGMAAAHMVQVQADAMKKAAANENGAMMGFMGMNMAQNAGGFNATPCFR